MNAANLAKATLGIYAVGVLLALSTDVSIAFANEARRVRQASVRLLWLRADPEGVLVGATVEANAGAGLQAIKEEGNE